MHTRFQWLLPLLVLLAIGITAWQVPSTQAKPHVPDLPSELQQSKFVMLDFYATWCGTCNQMRPHVEEIKRNNCDAVQVMHIDIEKAPNRKYVSRYNVRTVPTYILFDPQGKAVYKMDTMSPKALKETVSKLSGSTAQNSKVCR